MRETERLCRTLRPSKVALHLVHVGEHADLPASEIATGMPFEVTHRARSGDVVDQILAGAREYEADLIAAATAGHQGFFDVLRGSTTERVLRDAPCPVLAVPAD